MDFTSDLPSRLHALYTREVSAEWKDGRVVSCKVSADRKFAGKITANGKEYEIKLSSGETAEII